MKNTPRILRLSLLWITCLNLLALFSCRDDRTSQIWLSRAEQVMTTSPDSALWLLGDSVQTSVLSRRQYAEWCLLFTQAQDKNYVTHTSDSLIRIAVDYFEEHGPDSRQMLSYYYMGRVSQDLQRAPAATDYYLKALEVGKASDDYALLGRIHSNLGMLYTYQDVFDLALPQMKQALYYLEQLGDTASQAFVLRDMGRTYRKLDSLNLALQNYQRALSYAGRNSRLSILSELGGLHVEMKAYDKAELVMQEYLQSGQTPDEYVCIILGRLLADTGQNDSARYYLQKSMQSRQLSARAAAYYYLYKIAARGAKWKEYVRLHEIYDVLRDSISAQTYTETMLKMQHLYDYQQVEKEANIAKINQVRAERNSVFIVILAICIIGYLTGYFSYLRARRKRKRKALSNSFQEFRDKLNTKNIEQLKNNILQIAKLKSEIKKEEKDGEFILLEISLLGQIRQFIEKRIKEEEEKTDHLKSSQLYDLFQRGDIKDITDEKKEELRALINEAHPRFNTDIRKLYPSITNDDLFLCYLIKMGLTGVRISNIFYISQQAVSMKRTRLAQRLFGDEKSLHKLDDFISSL